MKMWTVIACVTLVSQLFLCHVMAAYEDEDTTAELIRALEEFQKLKTSRSQQKSRPETTGLQNIRGGALEEPGRVYRGEEGRIQGCGNTPADIVFVLDESGSIWPPDFDRQIKFVKDVVHDFDVSEGMTHIGAITFSRSTVIHFQLDEKHGEEEITNALYNITQRRGGTHTFEAIREMRDNMFAASHARDGVPHIAIVITDGKSEDMARTEWESWLAHQAGIIMFAIGVGPYVDETDQELHNIASSPDYVFHADSYTALDTLRNELSWRACQVTTAAPTTVEPTTTTTTTKPTTPLPQSILECDAHFPIDVQFAMSDQAGVAGTDLSIKYINEVVSRLSLGPEQTLVSVNPRACDSAAAAIHEKDHDSQIGVTHSIRHRNLTGAETDEHLRYMHNEGIMAFKGARPLENTARFGVLIIDNKASNKGEVVKQAVKAKKDGVHLVVLGVGPYIDEDEIDTIASSNNDWFHVNSYEELETLVDPVMDRLCELVLKKAAESGCLEESRGD